MSPEISTNPFIYYRRHLDVYQSAVERGVSDDRFVEIVEALDSKVADIWGTGFVVTPMVKLDLGDTPGSDEAAVWAKVETGNVSGSHKARHLFAMMIGLITDEITRDGEAGAPPRPDLAIASCGNAALGAAVVAAAAERRLQVFVPQDADRLVVAHLLELGAEVHPCSRRPGIAGDPCVHGLQAAVAAGAKPFTVQGPVCPQSIDGARTIGLELADQFDREGLWPDHVWIQIGGGALATAVMDGFERSGGHRLLPRLHPVQAESAHPYVAGWNQIAAKLRAEHELASHDDDPVAADLLAGSLAGADVAKLVAHWSTLMTPWPTEPHSVASGILDDIPYDWVTVMTHQIRSRGWPVRVTEDGFERAQSLAAQQTTPPPDATGAAGLAGLLGYLATGSSSGSPQRENHLVLLTGVDRSWSPT